VCFDFPALSFAFQKANKPRGANHPFYFFLNILNLAKEINKTGGQSMGTKLVVG